LFLLQAARGAGGLPCQAFTLDFSPAVPRGAITGVPARVDAGAVPVPTFLLFKGSPIDNG
jgi:hypothetical protein